LSDKYEYSAKELNELGTQKSLNQKRAKFYKRRSRKSKIILLSLIIVSLIATLIYYSLPISKVNKITYSGIRQTNQKIIEENLNIKYGDFLHNYNGLALTGIENIYNIENVRINKNSVGEVNVEILERKIYGYFKEGNDKILILANGQVHKVNENELIVYDKIPQLTFKTNTQTGNAIANIDEYVNFMRELEKEFAEDTPNVVKMDPFDLGVSYYEYAPEEFDGTIFKLYMSNKERDTVLINTENNYKLKYIDQVINKKNQRFPDASGEFDGTGDDFLFKKRI
jgi:cell division septal protein FtsQ